MLTNFQVNETMHVADGGRAFLNLSMWKAGRIMWFLQAVLLKRLLSSINIACWNIEIPNKTREKYEVSLPVDTSLLVLWFVQSQVAGTQYPRLLCVTSL